MTLLTAINTLEKACLADYDLRRTTSEELKAQTPQETKDYLCWLRRNAPNSSMFVPDYEKLTNKPE
jgi:hypothetical protein